MIVSVGLRRNKIMERNRNAKKLTDTARTKDASSSEGKCLFGLILFGEVYCDTKQPVKDLSYSNLASRPINLSSLF